MQTEYNTQLPATPVQTVLTGNAGHDDGHSKSKRDHAVALAETGFHVFPIDNDYPLDGWQNIATCDPAKVHRLWTDPVFDSEIDYNIGIATGVPFKGKILNALDVDVKDGKRGDKSLSTLEAIYDPIPETRRHRTTSGGKHILLLTDVPLANSVGKVGTGLDIRGRGGFIYAPGSERKGGAYTVELDAPIADCPGWLITMAGAAKDRPENEGEALIELDRPDAIERATYWLENEAPKALEGDGGDTTTYTVAARVGDFGISREQCFDLMADHWNETKADPPWDPDDLQTKVDNAYAHRTSPLGIAHPAVEMPPVEIDVGKAPPKRKGLYKIMWSDSRPNLDQPYLIDDVMDLGAMVVTYGDSNAGKTYVVLDQAFAIAAGRDWNGHKVKRGLVVYIAAEGGTGFQKRIEAYKRHHKATDLPFALVPCPIDLQSDQADTGKLVKLVRETEVEVGQKCVLVVVDTLARAIAGGDENTSVDMSKFVGHCDRLRAALGCTTNVIHHTGKDKSKGARGSSALRAATDTEIEIGNGALSVTKQRDMMKLPPMQFSLLGVDVGQRADGRPVSACVVEWRVPAEREFATPLTPANQEPFDALKAAIERSRKDGKPPRTSYSDWKSELRSLRATRGKDKGEDQAIARATPVLFEAGLLIKTDNGQYVIPEGRS